MTPLPHVVGQGQVAEILCHGCREFGEMLPHRIRGVDPEIERVVERVVRAFDQAETPSAFLHRGEYAHARDEERQLVDRHAGAMGFRAETLLLARVPGGDGALPVGRAVQGELRDRGGGLPARPIGLDMDAMPAAPAPEAQDGQIPRQREEDFAILARRQCERGRNRCRRARGRDLAKAAFRHPSRAEIGCLAGLTKRAPERIARIASVEADRPR